MAPAMDQLIFLEAGQGNDLNPGIFLPDHLGSGRAVHLRHNHIHQDDVRLDFLA
jgi:hypothetical protein